MEPEGCPRDQNGTRRVPEVTKAGQNEVQKVPEATKMEPRGEPEATKMEPRGDQHEPGRPQSEPLRQSVDF